MIQVQGLQAQQGPLYDIYALKSMFQHVYANHLLYLKQKSIPLLPLPNQNTSNSFILPFRFDLPLHGTHSSILCKISIKSTAECAILTIAVSYEISHIGGVKAMELNQRTRIQLISSLSQINQHLCGRHSCLTMTYNQFGVFAFQARQTIFVNSPAIPLKRISASFLKKSHLDFIKYLGELNEVNFFSQARRDHRFGNLQQLLQVYYTGKAKIFATSSKKEERSIKQCLAFMLANTQHHNSAIRSIQQNNQALAKYFHPILNRSDPTSTIGTAIKIHQVCDPAPAHRKKFYQNLENNKAVEGDSQAITLRNIQFEVRRSFGRLRQPSQSQADYFVYCEGDGTIFAEDVVFKRYIEWGRDEKQATQSTWDKSKQEIGHINQHNFIIAKGNLQCPYIAKYYLNIDESVANVANRTIMTRMEKGDLFTQVAYNAYHGLVQFSLIDYLSIFEQLAKAVYFLHENGIVHRDIKPTNVLFRHDSRNSFTCKLIDFGSCFVRREQSAHMFNPKVFTTPAFNLTYKNAMKMTCGQIGTQLSRESYESHQLFDIYGIAATVSYLLESSTPRLHLECLSTIISICKHPNPNLRFTPSELITLIQHLKLTLMASSVLDLRGRREQNN